MRDAMQLDGNQIEVLAALANGIIPASASDAGAVTVHAGPRLAEKVAAGVNRSLYIRGLETAERLARESYGVEVPELTPAQVHDLIGRLRDEMPGFFKQLRMDVSALYLSDPGVWKRIGFPGPSSQTGGYPDFDRPQLTVISSSVPPATRGAGEDPKR
jgi:hypothetical protein